MTGLYLSLLVLVTPAARADDAVFDVSVEAWVYSLDEVKHFDRALGPALAGAVRGLGCEHHHCRELAGSVLRAHPRGVRAAYWGSHARDPEVRSRSRKLLRWFLRCPHCEGNGWCPERVTLVGRGGGVFRPGFGSVCKLCYVSPRPVTVVGPDGDWVGFVRSDLRCMECDGSGVVLDVAGRSGPVPFYEVPSPDGAD